MPPLAIAALSAILLAAPAPPARPAPAPGARADEAGRARDALERRREVIAKEIVALAKSLRREIEGHDVAGLLALVPQEGLRCGDRVVPRDKVARDLRNEGSWIHGAVFGGPGYHPPAGTAPSLAALFRSAREVAFVVSFEPDPRAGDEGRPCLEFRSKDTGTPGTPLCFERKGDRWWLAESLYPCG
jgi:hypothetical protein